MSDLATALRRAGLFVGLAVLLFAPPRALAQDAQIAPAELSAIEALSQDQALEVKMDRALMTALGLGAAFGDVHQLVVNQPGAGMRHTFAVLAHGAGYLLTVSKGDGPSLSLRLDSQFRLDGAARFDEAPHRLSKAEALPEAERELRWWATLGDHLISNAGQL